MSLHNEPFFWALVSAFGLVGCCAVVGSKRVGRNTALSTLLIGLFDLGRFFLVLVDQPRFDLGGGVDLLGGVALVVGGYVALAPCFMIAPLNVAEQSTALQTSGFYAVVRNPIYLGELLWCLGWALVNHSTVGVLLVPVWWVALLMLIAIEEEMLERELGQPYRAYKQRVRGRIVPGLPV